MIERKIQTEQYWRTEFSMTDQDVEELGMLFLETERPLTVHELARMLITSYCRREETLIQRQLSRGKVYHPNGTFAVGENLVFPHLDFAVGTVVDQREGHNPEYGEFKVITVRFNGGGEGERRFYAAELQVPHKLAASQDVSWEDYLAFSPEDLYKRFGDLVAVALENRFRLLRSSAQGAEGGPRFVQFRQHWLPAEMLADLHVGHLNIAEALIDIQGAPLSPEALMSELELPQEIPAIIRVFSLSRALSQDSRFVDVGDQRGVMWSLRRWVPEQVLTVSGRLQYKPVAYDRTGLDVTHLQLEREIDDELSGLAALPNAANAQSVTVLLQYPHWRTGSLPLTGRTQPFFPSGSAEQRTLIVFVDRVGGGEFPGWVVHADRYVYGLGDWYKANHVPAGAYVRLERIPAQNVGSTEGAEAVGGATGELQRVGVDLIPRRMQREWVPMAYRNDEGQLAFQMQKQPVSCEYDELCLFGELDQADKEDVLDRLWQEEQGRGRSLDKIVQAVFPELVKINPNGMVHAKTIYAATNILRRCPPGPVFAILFKLPQFLTTGDGYWVYQEAASAGQRVSGSAAGRQLADH